MPNFISRILPMFRIPAHRQVAKAEGNPILESTRLFYQYPSAMGLCSPRPYGWIIKHPRMGNVRIEASFGDKLPLSIARRMIEQYEAKKPRK